MLQSQRLERAGGGGVFLANESDAVHVSPSPPPAYHTVVRLPPLSKPTDASPSPSPSSPARGGVAPDVRADVLAKLSAATCSSSASQEVHSEVDADGLPSYEAALKLESQGHICARHI